MIFHSYVTVYQKVNYLFQWADRHGASGENPLGEFGTALPRAPTVSVRRQRSPRLGSRHFGGPWEVLIFLGGWEYIYIYI